MTTKFNYLTEEEAKKFSREEANLQIAIGIQTCKTREEVCNLLEDIRLHERILLFDGLEEKTKAIEKKITDIENQVKEKMNSLKSEEVNYIG